MIAEDCVTPFFEIVTLRFPSMQTPITDLIINLFIYSLIFFRKVKSTEIRKGSSEKKRLKWTNSDYQILGKILQGVSIRSRFFWNLRPLKSFSKF